jgi:hypothetical protein
VCRRLQALEAEFQKALQALTDEFETEKTEIQNSHSRQKKVSVCFLEGTGLSAITSFITIDDCTALGWWPKTLWRQIYTAPPPAVQFNICAGNRESLRGPTG